VTPTASLANGDAFRCEDEALIAIVELDGRDRCGAGWPCSMSTDSSCGIIPFPSFFVLRGPP